MYEKSQMNLLFEKFPILKEMKDNEIFQILFTNKLRILNGSVIDFDFIEENDIMEPGVFELTQQDCLELSQLFALLATCYEDDSEENDDFSVIQNDKD